MPSLALFIGIGMVVLGLALGVYITIKIVEESRQGRDDSFDK
jgi:hypothetical protein